MKRKLLVQAASLLLLLLGVQAALADTVNFDNVANGTVINNTYAGVTFACYSSSGHCNGANSGDVYARTSTAAASAPNIISTLQTGVAGTQDNITGAILVSFTTAQAAVSIDSFLFQAAEGLGSDGYGYMRVYDSTFNELTPILTNVYGGDTANLGVVKTLAYSSATANISYLLLGDIQGANIITAFDNLCYSTSATGCTAGGGDTGGGGDDGGGGTSVPEPASLLMLGSGVFGLGAIRRRLQR